MITPAILSKKLNCKLYNFAMSGVGILSLLEQINHAENMRLLTKNSLILFCIPPPGRIDFIQHNKGGDERFVIDYWYYSSVLNGVFNDEDKLQKELIKQKSFIKYKKLYDAIGEDTDFLKMADLIHYSGVCGLINKLKDYDNMGIIGHTLNSSIDDYHNKTLQVLKDNNKNNIFFIENGFTVWAKQHNFEIKPFGHPGEEAHETLAKMMLNRITNNVI